MSLRLVASPSDDLDEDVAERIDEFERETLNVRRPREKEGVYWWLLENGDELCGYCGMVPYPAYETAFIYAVGVTAAYRGQGLQRRMMRAMERQARRDGLTRVVTYTDESNIWSANNFIRSGYVLYVPPQGHAPGWLNFWKRLDA